MIEKIKYKNHLSEVFQFGENGVYVNQSDLHDYEWSYNTDNNKISSFDRGIVKKTLPVVVATPNDVTAINNLMEICEKDVLNNTAGSLIIGDYSLNCYIVGSLKRFYVTKKGYCYIDLEIVTDSPAWVKSTTDTFSNTGGEAGKNYDFPHDFPYDFTSPNIIKTLTNASFADVDFKIIIYGGNSGISNPEITIGSHLYKVNCNVAVGEYLTIDSKEKTVYITENDGDIVNHFKDREKTSYIFQKIPSGEQRVAWSGNFVFDVILFEERSEPKWT